LSLATAASVEEDVITNLEPLERFLIALNAPETKRQYPKRLESFLDFLELRGTLEEKITIFCRKIKVKSDNDWLTNQLLKFLRYQKERVSKGEIEEATISNYFKAIKLFCEMNNILSVNWKLISRSIPKGRHASNDRPPSREEIMKLLEYPDRRIKPLVLIMVSSGIRIGAWDFLKWKHVLPVINGDKITAAKLIVYAGENEEYFTFITPEAYLALQEWMDFRSSYGEKITDESWLMRNIWRTVSMKYGAKLGLAKQPIQLKSTGIRVMIDRALQVQGIRVPLRQGEKRHEFKTVHGFRKFFKTQTEQVMKSINVEICMGHNIGVSKSYYKPSEKEILDDYLKAINVLSFFNQVSGELKKEIGELKDRNEQNEYLIRVKLQEKEDALNAVSDQLARLEADVLKLKKRK